MKKNKKINVITLGCSKNLVDSEFLMKQLQANGMEVLFDSDDTKAKTVIINTCGFIQDAKEESIHTILKTIEAKKAGLIDHVYVIGCLSERYKSDLKKEMPEVDDYFGKFDHKNLLKALHFNYKNEFHSERILTTPQHYAYLKISEGCNRTCSFCAIPAMTGKHRSKPMEDILEEANLLAQKGVKELLVIAQDLSFYGLDLYKKQMLPEIVKRLSDIHGIEWIKLHYAYPAGFPIELLDVMKERSNVCKYLDIALQHISDPMLTKMRRNISKKETYDLIEQIRYNIPGIALRTSIMVGHPGESEADFEELKQFVSRIRFERLGVFAYSHEEGTYADANYKDEIPQRIKKSRQKEIMNLQQAISFEHNQKQVDKVLKTIIDRKEGEYYIGRTEFDSPEVDNEVLISDTMQLQTGNFYNIRIKNSAEYDLFGEVNQI